MGNLDSVFPTESSDDLTGGDDGFVQGSAAETILTIGPLLSDTEKALHTLGVFVGLHLIGKKLAKDERMLAASHGLAGLVGRHPTT